MLGISARFIELMILWRLYSGYERYKRSHQERPASVDLAFAAFLLLLCLLEVVEEGIDVVVLLDQFEGEIYEPTNHYDGSRVD